MSSEVEHQCYPFSLPELPYAYDALEPHIDQQTLQLHHREHHAAYVKKLNEALANHDAWHPKSLLDLLREADKLPEEVRTAVLDNGGGHLNHDFFWNSMRPDGARTPRGALAAALAASFGSFENFRKQFSNAAAIHFASGWVALALDPETSALEIADLKDHETLVRRGRVGLLILDVWEHAYYLKYQNRRAEFIESFWNVVNWAHAEQQFVAHRAADVGHF